MCICDGVVINREGVKNNGINMLYKYISYWYGWKCVIIIVKLKYFLLDFFCNCSGIVVNSGDIKNNVIKL